MVTRVEIRIGKSIFQETCAVFVVVDVCATISVALKFQLPQLKPILESSLWAYVTPREMNDSYATSSDKLNLA